MSILSDEVFLRAKDLEINIRGSYLRFSAATEGLMVKCIIYLNELKNNLAGSEEKINFKNFTFSKKEEKFKQLLKDIYCDLFLAYSNLFEHFSKFIDMRNKVAHCLFKWDEFDLSYVTIWDLEDKNEQPHRIVPTKYTIQEITDLLNVSIKGITNDLNALATEVIDRVKPEIPYMFED